ncbi:hypothetical protein GOV12_06135 [Candidatus Pacearchaeota archaeon]|nr:hypothetical protein [Candidatus Pacearchaeota archaeon]
MKRLPKLPTLAGLTGAILLALAPNQSDAQERIIASWNLVESTHYHQQTHEHHTPYNNRTLIQTSNGWHEQINRGCNVEKHTVNIPHTTYQWQLQQHNQPRINLPQKAYNPPKRCEPVKDLLNLGGNIIEGTWNAPGNLLNLITEPCNPRPQVHLDIQVTRPHPTHYNYRH